MRLKLTIGLFFIMGVLGCSEDKGELLYESETLKIEQVSKNAFVHVSYFNSQDFGKVPCNGMVVIDNGEALVFDTPVSDSESKELIDWVEGTLGAKVKGVVVTHFHVDCLGGLEEFHAREIESYASDQTIFLAKTLTEVLPKNGFEDLLELEVGDKKVVSQFAGAGHTKDNIVSYFPSEKVLFGGCLIKETGAGKGNLEDADVAAWPATVREVKAVFGDANIIIPGHGKHGGQDLLDYTIDLFE
ncbi:subclass B1 metallo-beta-lactamase [Flammeovirgaceae bacterium SG7u.111]|nr:subclass B1 metallo-beta-lactamase [Flammeovirgaceae bacterium SG7u.132]WPO38203.1 subclass B1 metallo-beta-lactamase [Flammeovirgaceae bacterium SG7u.111]